MRRKQHWRKFGIELTQLTEHQDLSSDDFDENQAVYQLHNPTNANDQTHFDIETKITLFQPDSAIFSSILQYWESMKDTEPELYKLAMVVFAVHPTELKETFLIWNGFLLNVVTISLKPD